MRVKPNDYGRRLRERQETACIGDHDLIDFSLRELHSAMCGSAGRTTCPGSPRLRSRSAIYSADLGEGYARAARRRKVAAIARAMRHAGHPFDTVYGERALVEADISRFERVIG